MAETRKMTRWIPPQYLLPGDVIEEPETGIDMTVREVIVFGEAVTVLCDDGRCASSTRVVTGRIYGQMLQRNASGPDIVCANGRPMLAGTPR